jgi:predicted transcriptional regulator
MERIPYPKKVEIGAKKPRSNSKKKPSYSFYKRSPRPPRPIPTVRKIAYAVRYDPQLHPLVAKYMRRLGCGKDKIAQEFGVSENCLDSWIKQYGELRLVFEQSAIAENEKVVEKLFELTQGGLLHKETIEEQNIKWDRAQGQYIVIPTIKTVTRHIPPNEKAIEYWLSNRDPAAWNTKGNESGVDITAEEIVEMIKASVDAIDRSVIGDGGYGHA